MIGNNTAKTSTRQRVTSHPRQDAKTKGSRRRRAEPSSSCCLPFDVRALRFLILALLLRLVLVRVALVLGFILVIFLGRIRSFFLWFFGRPRDGLACRGGRFLEFLVPQRRGVFLVAQSDDQTVMGREEQAVGALVR